MDSEKTIVEALANRARKAPKPKARKAKAPKWHRPGKESTKTITNRLYGLWAYIAKTLAGNRCEITGETGILDAHHIIPRQICSGLRFEPQNAIVLTKSAHKFGRKSAHKNGIWFAEWLRTHHPVQYQYCLSHMDDELDCKDRSALYGVEQDLHERYAPMLDPLPEFNVTLQPRDPLCDYPSVVITAYNKKAAEFLAFAYVSKTQPMKGIIKTERV